MFRENFSDKISNLVAKFFGSGARLDADPYLIDFYRFWFVWGSIKLLSDEHSSLILSNKLIILDYEDWFLFVVAKIFQHWINHLDILGIHSDTNVLSISNSVTSKIIILSLWNLAWSFTYTYFMKQESIIRWYIFSMYDIVQNNHLCCRLPVHVTE